MMHGNGNKNVCKRSRGYCQLHVLSIYFKNEARKETEATHMEFIACQLGLNSFTCCLTISEESSFLLAKLIVVMNLTPSRNIELWNFYSTAKECANEIETNERIHTV